MAKRLKTLEEAQAEAEIQETAMNEVMEIKAQEEAAAEIAQAHKTQGEREQLIAEAARLQGRVEGLDFISKVVTVTNLMTLKNIKENKIYKDIPNVGTWENFCKSIGYSREKIDKDLENLATFGEEFLGNVTTFGIGYREMRQLKRAKSDGTFAIGSDSVVIEGEVIQLSDKDELKEALENLVAQQNRNLKEKANEIEAKEKLIKNLSKEKQQAYDEADENKSRMETIKIELEKMKKGQLDGIAPADRPDYNSIRECENQAAILYKNLFSLAGKDLSEFNEQMLGGVTMMLFQLAEDIRLTLAAKGRTYFDRMYMTDEELENSKKLLTPNSTLLAGERSPVPHPKPPTA